MQSFSKQENRSIKNLLIKPFQQVRFGLYIIAIILPFLILCGYLFYSSFEAQAAQVFKIFNIADPGKQYDFIVNNVFKENLIHLITLFSFFLAILFYTIFKLTHSVYGPLIGIERHLDKLINENYTEALKLRKNDELQNIAKKLNILTNNLENKKNKSEK